jgi:hypothetical protein
VISERRDIVLRVDSGVSFDIGKCHQWIFASYVGPDALLFTWPARQSAGTIELPHDSRVGIPLRQIGAPSV